MWSKDLEPWRYLPVATELPLRAVGWLERGKPFPTHKPDADTLAALNILYQRDDSTGLYQYDTSCFFAGGAHPCDLCDPETRSPGARGYSNLFVPGDREIFVCNDLIRHYVEAHDYAPPRRFINALLKNPPPVTFNPGGIAALRAAFRDATDDK